ncbi:MAG: hypothetical protein ISR58_13420 [Anaerolineales bacterium]|nr:hypothetical protein [Chloroflexota bacterium]MBL6982177.1 hypothetical protein [Anaerolineales bacterium]
MAKLQITLLGSFKVSLENKPVSGFKSDKARALLAYLSVEADRPHRREALAGLLWPDSPERKARTNLRSALANLRQVLGDQQAEPCFLSSTQQTIQFNPNSDYKLDVKLFLEGIGQYTRDHSIELENDLESLKYALDRYQGEFLAGFYLRKATIFENWVFITREALHRQALNGLHLLTGYYQEIGQYDQALRFAHRQVSLEPYQETGQQQVMWLLALNGQRNEALAQYQRFRKLLKEELATEPLEQTQAMHARILTGKIPESPKTTIILRRQPKTVGECPYRGLAPFREIDAPFFFGREPFTSHLENVVQNQSNLAIIVGSSGLGKSSVVYAGLLPKLQQDERWLLVNLRPSNQPIHALASALLPIPHSGSSNVNRYSEIQELAAELRDKDISLIDLVNRRLQNIPRADRFLLFIDQFEELYTHCSEPELRLRFLDILFGACEAAVSDSESSFVLILTLRADFMSRALAHRPFADALQDCALILGPMNLEELRAAIEKPAQRQGAAFETGLVARILDDVGDQPGNLPLLEFALTLLWEKLDQGWMTHAAYEEVGRVEGAIARYADEVYDKLNDEQRSQARQVFVQLVQPGRGTEDTRRVAIRRELGDDCWDVIQNLADKRLVVTDQDNEGQETVEIIHEALIQGWRRLRDWMDVDREFRVWQEQLRIALNQWDDSDQDEGALLHGVALSNAKNWLRERQNDLSELERRFIKNSLQADLERQREETIRQERENILEQRSRRFLQALTIVLLLAMLVSIGFARVARNEARQAIEAYSLSLAANARRALSDKDSTTALVFALAANQIERPPQESQRILLEAAFFPGPMKLYTTSEIFQDIQGPPLSVVIAPDGNTAMIGFFDGTIVLWDIYSGAEIRRFIGHTPGDYDPARVVAHSGVNDLAFSPDGLTAMSGGDDGMVILWDVNKGKEIRSFEGHSGAVRAVAFSPDGHTAVSGGFSSKSPLEPGELIRWDVSSGEEIRRYEGNDAGVVDVAISSNGRHLIASSGEVDYLGVPGQVYSLIQWDTETGEIIRRFEGIDRDLPAVDISPKCASFFQTERDYCNGLSISGSTDHNIYFWNLETGEKISTLEGHNEIVREVEFSPDGRRAISGGGDGELILWNVEKGEVVNRFSAHSAGINDITISPDGRIALSVAADETIVVWDLNNAALMNRFEGHEAAVLDVAFTPDGNHFISASGLPDPAAPIVEEDSLRLWNLKNGQQIGTLNWHQNDIFQIDISPDGRRVLSGLMSDQSVRLWDLATGQEIRRFEGHALPVISVAFAPDGRIGLSGAIDSTIILWDLETGEDVNHFAGHEGGVWALAVSPDGQTVLSGADDRLVILWDIETGEEIHNLVGHNDTVSGVAFSPSGLRAISADTEGLLIEWDLETGEEIQRFTGHKGTGPVGRTRVVYNHDGHSVLSSGWDGTLALWDLHTGREIYRFRGHDTDFIFDLAISPDGQSALSSGTDQMIIQWQLYTPSSEELFDWIAKNRFVRELTCDEKELFQVEPLCK